MNFCAFLNIVPIFFQKQNSIVFFKANFPAMCFCYLYKLIILSVIKYVSSELHSYIWWVKIFRTNFILYMPEAMTYSGRIKLISTLKNSIILIIQSTGQDFRYNWVQVWQFSRETFVNYLLSMMFLLSDFVYILFQIKEIVFYSLFPNFFIFIDSGYYL